MQHRESTAVQQPTVVTPSQNLVESLGNAQGTDEPFAHADVLKKKPVSVCFLQSSSSISFDIHGFKVFAPVDFLIKEGELLALSEEVRSLSDAPAQGVTPFQDTAGLGAYLSPLLYPYIQNDSTYSHESGV
ncbi:hypothetical protein AVEN_18307-1 [Araneus ventricosus]|uniref:Uncharacterized protein n=1 Tax=Araneus ventricosus TaxID=182803 RepID=A0A4Y2SAY4_ARAVE|nr:hypothetical protein AVEN_18307-1 [Araneus ventricosus]